ncbi:alpha/beta hydrolase [Vagococcus carniphilus]|uniref:Alpha/beta hydrolase n=1 Tax=Vagococcus carniphilus TaxID=218144 RepID=A0AAW8U5K3_9ENTE|nr:alpha/beta hydrolase [Vagococcus carniphilus]MDT2834793.1 alpha/beta hydrolase [Vagococcus carniphilus]
MKKVMKRIGIVLGIIVGIIVLIFLGLFINNKIQLAREAKKIDSVGEKITVNDQKMNIQIYGDKKETLVLLPGFMTTSPIIDFKPLTDELKKNFRVVVVEPFGYGLSDDTTRERSVENLTDEIHTALKNKGIGDYTLMAHSISGIYSLEYIKKYRKEVNAFIGIDSSLPSQGNADGNGESMIKFLSHSGLYRILATASPDLLNTPDVDNKLAEQYKYISLKNIGSTATINEAKSMPENFAKTKGIAYPKNFPVLYLLATESTDPDPSWEKIHQEMMEGNKQAELRILEGDHYLHHTKAKEIAEDTKQFLTHNK